MVGFFNPVCKDFIEIKERFAAKLLPVDRESTVDGIAFPGL